MSLGYILGKLADIDKKMEEVIGKNSSADIDRVLDEVRDNLRKARESLGPKPPKNNCQCPSCVALREHKPIIDVRYVLNHNKEPETRAVKWKNLSDAEAIPLAKKLGIIPASSSPQEPTPSRPAEAEKMNPIDQFYRHQTYQVRLESLTIPRMSIDEAERNAPMNPTEEKDNATRQQVYSGMRVDRAYQGTVAQQEKIKEEENNKVKESERPQEIQATSTDFDVPGVGNVGVVIVRSLKGKPSVKIGVDDAELSDHVNRVAREQLRKIKDIKAAGIPPVGMSDNGSPSPSPVGVHKMRSALRWFGATKIARSASWLFWIVGAYVVLSTIDGWTGGMLQGTVIGAAKGIGRTYHAYRHPEDSLSPPARVIHDELQAPETWSVVTNWQMGEKGEGHYLTKDGVEVWVPRNPFTTEPVVKFGEFDLKDYAKPTDIDFIRSDAYKVVNWHREKRREALAETMRHRPFRTSPGAIAGRDADGSAKSIFSRSLRAILAQSGKDRANDGSR